MLSGVSGCIDQIFIIADYIQVALRILVEYFLFRKVYDIFLLGFFATLLALISILDALVNHAGELAVVLIVHSASKHLALILIWWNQLAPDELLLDSLSELFHAAWKLVEFADSPAITYFHTSASI